MSRGRRRLTLIPLTPKKRNWVREKHEKAVHKAALKRLDELFSLLNGLAIQRRTTMLCATLLIAAAATAPAGPRLWSENWKLFAFVLGQGTIVMVWMWAIRMRVRRRLSDRPVDWASVIRLERWAVKLAMVYSFIAAKLWVYSWNMGPMLAPLIEPHLPGIGTFFIRALLKSADWIFGAVVGTIALAVLSRRISLIRNAVLRLASLDESAAS